MTNPVLSNEVENRQVILWQYDHAPNLIGLIDGFNQIASDTVTQFWDYFRDKVFNIETADYFGLNVLGRLMGLPRPSVDIGESSPTPISDGLFRRLLKGRFFLFGMSPTVPNYNKYLTIIWGRLPMDVFPIVYSFPGEEAVEIADPGSLAYVEREETVFEIYKIKFLDVYDSRSNTLIFTMRQSAEVGTFIYLRPNPTEGFQLTFDGEEPSLFETQDRAAVVDGGMDGSDPMAMHFPAPEEPTDEELAMHEQHPDLIYFYPAGIRTNGAAESSAKVIGMAGQPLENFADAFSWVKRPTASGGILAGNEKAKFLDGEDGNEGGDNG